VSELPAQEVVWQLTRGALATRAVAVVADLGVADALVAGPRPVTELAADLGADDDALHRYLRALASDGIFEEREPGIFANTDASQLLRRDVSGSWCDVAHLFGGVFYRAVGDADAATGEATFPRTFGDDFWSWLAAHPGERAAFDRAMASGVDREAERLASCDWRGDETVVDVGGGNGSLLRELLRLRPGLTGIAFDLPETNRDEATLGERCSFVAGSFFERVPEGDVYVLAGILHDWDDERAATILRTIRDCARTGARVLMVEAVIPPGNEPHGSKWLDLLMLTLAGGRERTAPEWRDLLDGAGFEVERLEDGLIEARCR
jgi:hypothetical protein